MTIPCVYNFLFITLFLCKVIVVVVLFFNIIYVHFTDSDGQSSTQHTNPKHFK